MTAVIRYVTNTMDGAANTPSVNSTGTDSQLLAFDITTTVGIAAGADADVLVWKGSGTIKSIEAVTVRVIATGEIIPMGAVAQNTHALMIIDTPTSINISVPVAGAAIPANSLISLLLVIGNY